MDFPNKPVDDKTPKVYVMPLSEEEIAKLPFPETARKIGGLLILSEDALENHLNIEDFRSKWNKAISNK